MGSQQFLLISLCFIIIGASIRVGVNQYKAAELEQNKMALIDNIRTIATDAFIYRIKGENLGGGKASYTGYKLDKKQKSDDAGKYKVSVSKDKITITATSQLGFGTIKAAYDKEGKYVKKSIKYTGTFKK